METLEIQGFGEIIMYLGAIHTRGGKLQTHREECGMGHTLLQTRMPKTNIPALQNPTSIRISLASKLEFAETQHGKQGKKQEKERLVTDLRSATMSEASSRSASEIQPRSRSKLVLPWRPP